MKATISGIRGVVGNDLDLRKVARFCGAFAGMTDGACVLGRDTRPSSSVLYEAAAAALTGGGVDVLEMGITPTPIIFRESRRYGSGVMVTSSHNPITWNGLKFVVNGKGASHAMMHDIVYTSPKYVVRCGSRTPISTTYEKEAAQIVGDVHGDVSVLVDAGRGAAADVAPRLLHSIGCRPDSIQGEVRPDPTAGGLDVLAARSQAYDMGVAFDMDGDRMVLAMDGRVQPADATLGLGVAAAMERGHRNFVFSADTSIQVTRYVRQRGGRVWRSPVGEANVVSAMADNGADAGGEGSSAGFILGEFNWCRDGILTAGLIASIISSRMARHALQEITDTHIIREKVCCDTSILQHMEEPIRAMSSEIDMSDGIYGMIDENSWVLVRASNTEDVLRISAEAKNAGRCGKLVREITRWARDAV